MLLSASKLVDCFTASWSGNDDEADGNLRNDQDAKSKFSFEWSINHDSLLENL